MDLWLVVVLALATVGAMIVLRRTIFPLERDDPIVVARGAATSDGADCDGARSAIASCRSRSLIAHTAEKSVNPRRRSHQLPLLLEAGGAAPAANAPGHRRSTNGMA